MSETSFLGEALKCALAWLDANGWAGYDPYDVRGTSLFLRLNRHSFTSAVFKVFCLLFPRWSRLLLRIPRNINAKAVALIAHASLDTWVLRKQPEDLSRAQRALVWLESHPSTGYSGLCWGYPFDWDNRTFIPRGTPSSVVTAIAAESFLRAYELLGDPHWLEVARSCAVFIARDLQRDEISEQELCFSYTPLDRWHVHNANLFSCATLARVGYLSGTNEWADLVRRGTAYTLRAQRADGAWAYWGPPDGGLYMVDHYHTGFVLRCLDIISRYSDVDVLAALERGYIFYREHLFTGAGLPKRTEDDLYPIDIHSCAEAILCLTALSERFPTGLSLARRVAEWTVSHMQAADGHFFYRRYPGLIIRFPFVRWSQAWMLRALSALLLAEQSSMGNFRCPAS